MVNVILILIILFLLGASCFYIYKSKQSGKKCIGCSSACSCSHKKN